MVLSWWMKRMKRMKRMKKEKEPWMSNPKMVDFS